MVLHEEYTQQYAAHAVSHLEVFYIDRPTLLSTADGFEHAARRLRRWALIRALRSYMIANRLALKSGGEGLDLQRRAPAANQLLGNDSFSAPRVVRATPPAQAAVAAPPPPLVAAADVAALREDVAELKSDMATLKQSMAELLRRTAR